MFSTLLFFSTFERELFGFTFSLWSYFGSISIEEAFSFGDEVWSGYRIVICRILSFGCFCLVQCWCIDEAEVVSLGVYSCQHSCFYNFMPSCLISIRLAVCPI